MKPKRRNTHSTKGLINWQSIIPSVIAGLIVGAILGAVSGFIYQERKITRLEERIKFLEQNLRAKPMTEGLSSINSKKIPEEPKVKPEELITIIKIQQKKYVKESWGTHAYQCFTDDDLKKFEDDKVPIKIVEKLKTDNKFIDIVLAIKDMTPSDWQDLKERSLSTYKRTWTELGKVDREGQTEAGQKAEKMIAEAIVDLVIEFIKKSREEIKRFYSY